LLLAPLMESKQLGCLAVAKVHVMPSMQHQILFWEPVLPERAVQFHLNRARETGCLLSSGSGSGAHQMRIPTPRLPMRVWLPFHSQVKIMTLNKAVRPTRECLSDMYTEELTSVTQDSDSVQVISRFEEHAREAVVRCEKN
jgi:hypothetical protein